MPANKLLSYPHDVFLMVRLEFVQICHDELEAKILRIIERYVDEERTHLFQETVNKTGAKPEQVMSVTKDVWVPISYRLFMSDLFGTVTSENTIKKAIKNLLDKKIIFRRFDKKNRYDAPEYRIHISVLQMLLEAVGKSVGKPGYQLLIPSIIDTLKNSYPHDMTPSECQELMLSTALRVSKVDTTYNNSNGNNTSNIENVSADAERTPASSEFDQEQQETLEALQAGLTQSGVIAESPIATTDTPTALLQAEQERDMHNGHGNTHHHGTGDSGDRGTLLPLVPVDGDTGAAGTQPAQEVIPIGVDKQQGNGDKSSGKRKPGKPKEPAVSPERIDAVFDCLDKMACQVTGDASFKYDRSTKTSREKVAELLKDKIVTQEALEAVYLELWNTPPDAKTGFDWKNNMSVKAICNNFERVWLSIKGKIQTKQAQTQNGQKVSAAVKAGYTDYTNSPPVEYRPLRMPGDRKRA